MMFSKIIRPVPSHMNPLLTIYTAKQGPLPGKFAFHREATNTPDPGLVHPESVMQASGSSGAL